MTIRHDVALARREGVAARADRPSQRRCAEERGSGAVVRAAVRDLQVREADDGSGLWVYEGHASVTEQGYEMYDMFGPYVELVAADAFDATLNRADLDVPLVIAHDQTRRIARTTNGTLTLSIDNLGLKVEAILDPADVDVAYIVPKLRAHLIDEMSFAFRIEKGEWSSDWTQYNIQKVDIHRGDVAIVGYGANPYTDGGMRTAPAIASKRGTDIVPESDLVGRPAALI